MYRMWREKKPKSVLERKSDSLRLFEIWETARLEFCWLIRLVLHAKMI